MPKKFRIGAGFNRRSASISSLENPVKANGHLQMLYGNLATEGSVAKISGKEGDYFEGTAKVFDDEYAVIDGVKTEK